MDAKTPDPSWELIPSLADSEARKLTKTPLFLFFIFSVLLGMFCCIKVFD